MAFYCLSSPLNPCYSAILRPAAQPEGEKFMRIPMLRESLLYTFSEGSGETRTTLDPPENLNASVPGSMISLLNSKISFRRVDRVSAC